MNGEAAPLAEGGREGKFCLPVIPAKAGTSER
jgi:hypothetical protein